MNDLIKCKDCEFWKKQKDSLQGRCYLMGTYPTGEWYCANARNKKSKGKQHIECENCKYYREPEAFGGGYCMQFDIPNKPNNYCSWGKEKEK